MGATLHDQRRLPSIEGVADMPTPIQPDAWASSTSVRALSTTCHWTQKYGLAWLSVAGSQNENTGPTYLAKRIDHTTATGKGGTRK